MKDKSEPKDQIKFLKKKLAKTRDKVDLFQMQNTNLATTLQAYRELEGVLRRKIDTLNGELMESRQKIDEYEKTYRRHVNDALADCY